MFCPNCGKQIQDNAKFCESCGTVLNDQFMAAPPPAYAAVPPPVGIPTMQQPFSAPSVSSPAQAAYYQQPAYYAPDINEPMSIGSYIGTFLLMSIPVAGFILLLIWAFSSSVNRNKKNLARAILIFWLIGIVLSVIFSGTLIAMFTDLFKQAGL
jgi:hypothetical protein